MRVREESENVGLKLNIQKTKIMASGPITSWQIDGETMETVTDFNFGGAKITADGDCSHETKRCLLLGSYGQPRQLSPLVTINLFFVSVSLYLFCKSAHLCHLFIVHIQVISYDICLPLSDFT